MKEATMFTNDLLRLLIEQLTTFPHIHLESLPKFCVGHPRFPHGAADSNGKLPPPALAVVPITRMATSQDGEREQAG